MIHVTEIEPKADEICTKDFIHEAYKYHRRMSHNDVVTALAYNVASSHICVMYCNKRDYRTRHARRSNSRDKLQRYYKKKKKKKIQLIR